MPVYKINPVYLSIDPDPIALATFMNEVNNSTRMVGHFESYVEDYEKVKELLSAKYGPSKPVGGFVDYFATVKNQQGDTAAKMIVAVAFEDKAGNPRFLAENDWVVGKCPPNDRPQRADEDPAPLAEVLASIEEAFSHLRIEP